MALLSMIHTAPVLGDHWPRESHSPLIFGALCSNLKQGLPFHNE